MITQSKINSILKGIILTLFVPALFAVCSLEGDVNALRKKPYLSSSPSIAAPDIPVVVSLDGLLTVSWAAVEDAENYEVYIGTSQYPPVLPAKTVSATTTVLDGLVNKTVYYVWIKAVNSSGYSDFSPRACGIPWSADEIPAVPARPVIIPGINQLTLNWEGDGGASSYEVYINTSAAKPPAPEIISDKTSAVIKNLNNDVIYYLWLRAVNSAGKSDYSPPEAGTPKIPTVAPAVPGKPVVIAGNCELAVFWQTVELTESYEVWVGATGDSNEAQKHGSDITGTDTVITGLDNETTYYVWIKAKNIIGTSGFSPSASAKPSAFAAVPETPAAPTVITGSGALDVSWQPTEGALFYEVWTGTSNNIASAEKYGEDLSAAFATLAGLSNGATYYIWVKAKNNTGTSGFSPMASGTPSLFAVLPAVPQTAPVVIAGNGQLTVSWQLVEGASVYEVWMGTSGNSDTAEKYGSDISGASTVITGLTNGAVYYIWLKAKNSVGASGFSPAVNGMPQVYAVTPQPPAVPAVSVGNEQLTVSWTAVQGATAYEIWLAAEDNSASAIKHGADISNSIYGIISSLNNGTAYYIWVKAKNSYGTSGFSPVVNGIPIADAAAPSLIADNAQITVNWAAIDGADQYQVFYGTGINPLQEAAQVIDAPVTSATIAGLVNGTTYNVWVRGKNSTGTGAMSSPASGKPIDGMGTVTLSAGNEHLSLSWSPAAGADEYEVYCSAADSIPESPAQTVSATTAAISGLVNGATYYVWVKAKNANGTGSASAVASGMPLGVPEAPALTAGYKSLSVSWTAVAGADEYEVYYGIGAPATLAATTSGTTAIITGLSSGTAYYVRLRAKNASGVSGFGTSASGEPNDSLSPGLYRNGEEIGNQNLNMSLSYISANAVSGDDFIIVLGENETIAPATLSYSGKTVGITLVGYSSSRTISLSSNGSMFTVDAGVTLTLDENVGLLGRSANNASLVIVKKSGTLVMNDRAYIYGNKYVASSGSSSGGGVYNSGTFTMHGGTISGNYTSVTYGSSNDPNASSASYGGGVYNSGTFTMHGGTISGNRVRGPGSSSDASYGGGVCNSETFTMYDGTISGNTSNSTNGTSYGGGVSNFETFIMYGGIISGNTSTSTHAYSYSYGGGIYTVRGYKKLPLEGYTQSGIIYGSEAVGDDADGIPLRNIANSQGHAIFFKDNSSSHTDLQRNTTAWETDHIDSTTGKGLSANGKPPFGE